MTNIAIPGFATVLLNNTYSRTSHSVGKYSGEGNFPSKEYLQVDRIRIPSQEEIIAVLAQTSKDYLVDRPIDGLGKLIGKYLTVGELIDLSEKEEGLCSLLTEFNPYPFHTPGRFYLRIGYGIIADEIVEGYSEDSPLTSEDYSELIKELGLSGWCSALRLEDDLSLSSKDVIDFIFREKIQCSGIFSVDYEGYFFPYLGMEANSRLVYRLLTPEKALLLTDCSQDLANLAARKTIKAYIRFKKELPDECLSPNKTKTPDKSADNGNNTDLFRGSINPENPFSRN